MIKMLTDSDKHRVLPGGFGAIHLGEIEFTWDVAVAQSPTIEPLISPDDSLKEKTAIKRIRFQTGNAKAKVGVNRQPPAEVMFECGDWALSMHNLNNCVATTRRCLTQMAALFPGQTFPWPART